jgi:outer membrane lipoprotein-sorting protein
MRRLDLTAALVLICVVLVCSIDRVAAEDSEAADPWQRLQSVRATLTATPTSATFVQEFQPAGFTSGDRESGVMYLALPDCIRWDYQLPFAKSFLLCNETIYLWNSGETTGRRHALRVSEQPGLDLMTLQVDLLRERYQAEVVAAGPDQIELTLSPRAPDTDLASATLIIDPRHNRPISIQYADRQGNLTRFDLADYQTLDRSNLFDPPADIQWLDR